MVGIILASMVGIVRWSAQTRFKALFSEMNKEDATMVARMLEEKKIDYQFSEDGKTISIPEDQVEIYRLELAKQGLEFTGTVGYEVFDKQSFGTTTYVQKINKQRALEGELVKTIKYIKGVKRARVHLTIPESSPFASEMKAPSASVVLELDNGITLIPTEIKGIASLISASVEGLRSENVVIIDSRGKKLSENVGEQMTADTANRIALEAKLAQQYEDQVKEILSKVIGEGKVAAKVSVVMDFTQSSSTETTYDNENTAIISEVSNTQKLVGSRPGPQGIPGARSNLPGENPQPQIPETKNDIDKQTHTRNYQVPTKVTQQRRPTANIKNISVAVMVDGQQIPQMDKDGKPLLDNNGYPITKYKTWSEGELSNFNEIVKSTLGLDFTRGDKLVIKNMKFVHEDLSAAEIMLKNRENRELIKNIIKYLAIGLMISLFFIVVVRPFIQWITENTMESVSDFLPKTIEELEKIQTDQKLPGLEEALPVIEEKLNPEKVEGNLLKEKIISLVEDNPAKAAQIIHSMIHMTDSEKQIS